MRPDAPTAGGHLGVIAEFVDIIRNGDWSAHVGREALVRTRVIDACYASALAGREVSVVADP